MKRSRQKWFGVKTLYRLEALGRPKVRDRHFDPRATLVEERIVLIRARDHDEAIRKAEREARRYAPCAMQRNIYGQRLRNRFLEALDSFELFDAPGAGREVFSTTFRASRATTDQRLIDARVITPEPAARKEWRRNFVSHVFDSSAGA